MIEMDWNMSELWQIEHKKYNFNNSELLVLLCELFIKAGTWQILRRSGTRHKGAASLSALQLHVILPTWSIEKMKWCWRFIVSRSLDRLCHNISGYCSWQMRTSLTLTSFVESLFNKVPVKKVSPCDCICTFFWSSFIRCSVYKKTKVNCICSANQTEHKRKYYYAQWTKPNWTSAKYTFNRSKLVTYLLHGAESFLRS